MKTSEKYNSKLLFVNLFFLFISMIMIFGRSFTGVKILGYRLGEIIILFAFLWSLTLFTDNPVSRSIDKKIINVHRVIVFSFFIYVVLSGGSFVEPYTYKSSSYIWTLIFIYLGIYLYENKHLLRFDIKILLVTLPLTYVLSSVYYPKFIQRFFINYSDVLDFLKASDLLLVFVVTNYMFFIASKNYKSPFIYLIVSGAIFFPYMAFKSKGAILPGIIFLVLMLYQYKNFIFKKKSYSLAVLLIGLLLFSVSSLRTFGGFENVSYGLFFSEREEDIKMHEEFTNFQSIVKTQADRYDPDEIPDRYQTQEIESVDEDKFLNIIPPEKQYENVSHFWIFTLADGRIYSNETNIDYRLQIWQDVMVDLNIQNRVLTGYAYNEIIPAMLPPERRGWDGSNENVHNYLINIFARGGIFHLFLFLTFYYQIISYWKRNNDNLLILVYMLPVFFTSLFDVTMESVRYPLIYFTFLGFFINFKKKIKEDLN